jgi:hypothetical protein
MNHELTNAQLLPEQEQQILQSMADIEAKLPFLLDLSVSDRRGLPKMGDKSRAFVDHGLVLALQNGNILPRNFNIEEYQHDVQLVRQLESLVLAMRRLMKRLEDTYLAAGSDAYGQTLLVYQAAKLAGKDGSLAEHLDTLSRRFARKSPGPAHPPVSPE